MQVPVCNSRCPQRRVKKSTAAAFPAQQNSFVRYSSCVARGFGEEK